MNLSNIKPANGSIRNKKRIARGEGSGKGGTSTRGHKGQKSRSGYSKKVGFEGGQMPLQRRVPKYGFTNINRIVFKTINLDTIQSLVDSKKIKDKVDVNVLIDNGLAKRKDLVKILGRGKLNTKLTFYAHKFSKSAKENILSKGGSINIL